MLKEVYFDETAEEDIVIYFENEIPVHAGKLVNSKRIISKWGQGGHLWEHATSEVPVMYGGQIKFFKDINKEPITKSFLQYAESKGVK